MACFTDLTSKELPPCHTILSFIFRHHTTEVSDNPLLAILHRKKDWLYALSTCICIRYKYTLLSRVPKNRRGSKGPLQFCESRLAFLRPVKLNPFHHLLQRLSYVRQPSDKPSVIWAQSDIAPHLFDIPRSGPLRNCFAFLGIRCYTLTEYNMPQVLNFSLKQLTFRGGDSFNFAPLRRVSTWWSLTRCSSKVPNGITLKWYTPNGVWDGRSCGCHPDAWAPANSHRYVKTRKTTWIHATHWWNRWFWVRGKNRLLSNHSPCENLHRDVSNHLKWSQGPRAMPSNSDGSTTLNFNIHSNTHFNARCFASGIRCSPNFIRSPELIVILCWLHLWH